MRRTFAHGVALAGALALVATFSVRCADVNRGIGAACIRNADCLSGLCEGQTCVGLPPTFDANPPFDAGVDAPLVSEAGSPDAGTPVKDSGHPTPDASDAKSDVIIDATGDAVAADAAPGDAPEADGPSEAEAPDAALDGHAEAQGVDAHPGDGHASDAPLKDGASG